jgi:hypothetical protein
MLCFFHSIQDNNDFFPFLHSTEISPEWPMASLPAVPTDVSREVQEALLSLGAYAQVGQQLEKCSETLGAEICDFRHPTDFYLDAPCDTTWPLAELAKQASKIGSFAGFRTSRSYTELRSMQQEAGFMVQDAEGKWHCTRPSNLYEGITCPDGYFKRDQQEFENGCSQIGLDEVCNSHDYYDCFCKPCVRAYDVDVYEWKEGDKDPHLVEFYGDELPSCKKMSICGTLQQGHTITLRIYDNKMRDNAEVVVTEYTGERAKVLAVHHISGTYAYEVTVSDFEVGIHVIDILVNNEPISQSPVRVMVRELDCNAIFGEDSGERQTHKAAVSAKTIHTKWAALAFRQSISSSSSLLPFF